MAGTVTVKIKGADELMKRLLRLKRISREAAAKVIAGSVFAIERDAKRAVVVDTGRLRSSIRPLFTRGGLSGEVFTDVDYAAFVEYGTAMAGAATHKGPLPVGYQHGTQHSPPSAALINWARRHKIGGGDYRGGAYLIARAIRRRGGIPARPFLFPAFHREAPRFLRKIRDALLVYAPKQAKA